MKQFKIYHNQIPENLINNLLKSHERFKKNPIASFRAQGKPVFEKPELDSYGNQINSIHNPHLLIWSGLGKKIRPIIHHENIAKCLADFYETDKNLVHYQAMLFDKSTATTLHQDTWYLDTNPKGRLVGVWIALEDIEEESGPFYVYPNSGKKHVSINDYNFNDIENEEN